MTGIAKAAIDFAIKSTIRGKVLARTCTTDSVSSSTFQVKDVPGLSKKIVDLPAVEVGFPKASKKGTYKNAEYFCYHNLSYFEAEVEMMRFRLPQPSNKASK